MPTTTNNRYSARRRNQKAAIDADHAEFAAIVRGTAVVDAGVYDDRIAGILDQEAAEQDADRPAWQRLDLASDDAVGRVAEEIQRRAQVMADAYPFEVMDGQLQYRPSRTGFYEFCLAASCAETITKGDFVKFPRFFERVVTLLVRSYLGTDSQALHIGSPREEEIGSRFMDAMKVLHERSGDWHWSPEEGLPADGPAGTGDEGVDFVVWKPIDNRPGKIFVLGQCACGDDWEEKFDDINLEKLWKWIRPRPFPDPIRVFATPHHLSDGHLREAQREAGLVLDRARLSLFAEKLADDPEIAPWRAQMREVRSLVLKPLGSPPA
jgi:hypothetical protein